MLPKHIVPGTPMKDFGLWEDKARSLTAYPLSLRGTGSGAFAPGGRPSD